MGTLYIASDHTGLALKELLKEHLISEGYEVEDLGAHTFDGGDDYPDFVTPCAKKVATTKGTRGIVIGGSGHGEAMAANRIPGVRAAVFYGAKGAHTSIESEETPSRDGFDIVRVARMHNDANMLSLGARFVSDAEAIGALQAFLETAFSGEERHIRRIQKF